MSKLLVTGASNATEDYVSGAQHFSAIVKTAAGFSTLVNTAASGQTHQYFLTNISSRILSHAPDLCLFLMPANEMAQMTIAGDSVDALRDAIVTALAGIIDACQGANIPLMVISPPVGKVAREALRWPAVLSAVRDLCHDEGVLYVPFYERMSRRSNLIGQTAYDNLVRADPDQYHLAAPGHALLGNTVLTYLASLPPPAIELPEGQCWDGNQAGTNLVYPGGDFLAVKQASGTAGGSAIGTVGKSSGKWYFEVTLATAVSTVAAMVGVTRGAYNQIISLASTGADDYWYDTSGRLNTNGSPATATGKTTWEGQGHTVGVLLDLDNDTLNFIDRNGALVTGFASLPAGTYKPIAGQMSGAANGNVLTANFEGPFVHTVPEGYAPFTEEG